MNFNSVAHLDPEILPIEVDQLLRLRSNPLYGLGLRQMKGPLIAHTPPVKSKIPRWHSPSDAVKKLRI